jgi:hypothetical protein
MRQLLILPQRLPGLNDMVAKHRFIYGKLKQETELMIEWEIRRQGIKKMPYAYISLIWFEENTKRDPDNICAGVKFINDALVNCKILPGDGWAHVLGLKHQFVHDKKSSVHITLTDKLEA